MIKYLGALCFVLVIILLIMTIFIKAPELIKLIPQDLGFPMSIISIDNHIVTIKCNLKLVSPGGKIIFVIPAGSTISHNEALLNSEK